MSRQPFHLHELGRDVYARVGNGTTPHLPSLLSKPTADVRELAAVFALNRAIGGANTVTELETAVAGWAKTQLGCDDAKFLDMEAAWPNGRDQEAVLEVRTGADGGTIFVPAHGASAGWMSFTTSAPVDGAKDSLCELLVLAGAICGARWAQIAKLRVVQEESDTFRRQAIGSARAFLGTSAGAEEIAHAIPRLAISDAAVLLLGEVGVGKRFVARLIHESGPRKNEPLRIVNCAAIVENGKESGFKTAERGTLLLDGVGELPLASQDQLLHLLEAKELDARVLATSHRDLEERIAAGAFRGDLYSRISGFKIEIPPLRERRDDIALLATRMLTDLAESSGRRVRGFSPAALESLQRYPWPGNVRELRNAIERALALGNGARIEASELPAVLGDENDGGWVELPMNEDRLNERNREAALRRCAGNKTRAAALLGIRRARLYKK
ncbi:sigma 54-interacting transcriptional regulator [Pendulispora brunnea]|uniref:Sigma 54-interacting transcriptional regulator n=1 Tax=Pendulispora brunnea TaxID=2905690 RepID=A0ABZ2KL09_9BACT